GDSRVVVRGPRQELEVRLAGAGLDRRKDGLSDELAVHQRRREVIDGELLDRQRPPAARGPYGHGRVQGGEHRRRVLRWIGVREIPADRRLIADADRGDAPERVGQGWT